MKILIVDDNKDSRRLLETTFTQAGYAVSEAENGIMALKAIKREIPDLIISDILMPELDGFKLCKEIKRDHDLKHIPFIIYTAAYVDSKYESFAKSIGAAKFIIKPIEMNEFLIIVNEVLRKDKNLATDFTENTKK